jgi:hypothetical protein
MRPGVADIIDMSNQKRHVSDLPIYSHYTGSAFHTPPFVEVSKLSRGFSPF